DKVRSAFQPPRTSPIGGEGVGSAGDCLWLTTYEAEHHATMAHLDEFTAEQAPPVGPLAVDAHLGAARVQQPMAALAADSGEAVEGVARRQGACLVDGQHLVVA